MWLLDFVDLVFLEVCDCVITGHGVIIALVRMKEQEALKPGTLWLDVEINCHDHVSFAFFLAFAFLASFKAHLFYICSVRGNYLHGFFFFFCFKCSGSTALNPRQRVNVRLGDRYCILFALCLLGAVAPAGVCMSVSMPWAWTFVCRPEVGIEYLSF